jgi:hypothetical protein
MSHDSNGPTVKANPIVLEVGSESSVGSILVFNYLFSLFQIGGFLSYSISFDGTCAMRR